MGLPKVFDMAELTNAHLAVGNGQHLPCAALALLATLLSVELFPEPTPHEELVASSHHNVEVNVAANGRCLWACLYLHFADESEKKTWANIGRNQAGFALETSRQKEEDRSSMII